MKLHIQAEGFDLTPDIKSVVDHKFVPKLQKFLKRYPEDSAGVRLMLEKNDRWGFKAKCDLDIPGQNIYAEATHKDLASAIIALANDAENRLRKQKEKSLEKK